ncbi:MAG: hypothetical protein MUC81_11575 [Bacteroidia bacterium]|jgi:hypothetical protein|nr:hypothetical protein [Bacteroidia bacterium]
MNKFSDEFYRINSIDSITVTVKSIHVKINEEITSTGRHEMVKQVIFELQNFSKTKFYLNSSIQDSLSIENSVIAKKQAGIWGVEISDFNRTYVNDINNESVNLLYLRLPVDVDSVKIRLNLYNNYHNLFFERFFYVQ